MIPRVDGSMAEVAKELLERSEAQIADYRESHWRSGARFNLFKVLRRGTDEVHGHSSFIAELLNPNGSHGKGPLFLDLFLDTLGIRADLAGVNRWQVEVEKDARSYGRLDILLSARGPDGSRVGIAIENKIHAEDGDKQLCRYRDYLTKKFDRFLLYYLTLSGDPPSSQSCFEILPKDRQWDEAGSSDAPVRLLSYSYHMRTWLQSCREEAYCHPYVRESVSQYHDLISSLTGNGGTMTESLLPLLDSPEKLEAASKLSRAVAVFKERTVNQLWEAIKDDWQKRTKAGTLIGAIEGNQHCGNLNSLRSRTKEYFSKQRNVPRWFGLAGRGYEYKGRRVGVEVRFDGHFYVGLYGDKTDKVLDIEDVSWFYEDFKPPERYSPGTFDSAAARERVYVKSDIEFDGDKEVFSLVSDDAKNKLVEEILDLAESMLTHMGKRGLKASRP